MRESRLSEIVRLADAVPAGPWAWRIVDDEIAGCYQLMRLPVGEQTWADRLAGDRAVPVDPSVQLVTALTVEQVLRRPVWQFIAESRQMVNDLLLAVSERDAVIHDMYLDGSSAVARGQADERSQLVTLVQQWWENQARSSNPSSSLCVGNLLGLVRERGKCEMLPPSQARAINARYRNALEAIAWGDVSDSPNTATMRAVARMALTEGVVS